MQTYLFNDSWFFTDSDDLRARFHSECAPLMEVTLPHDAMIGKKRSPNVRRGNLAGYYPGGTYVYTKTYFFPPETAQSHCVLEFGGVYANAMFFVNDCFAGKCPYGYSRFFLDLDKFLRHGENNVIKVVSRSGADTRCYSGGGIYRDVRLHVSGLLYIEPDGLRVDTCSLERDLAVIGIRTTLTNKTIAAQDTLVIARITDPAGNVVAEDTTPVSFFPQAANTIYQKLYVPGPEAWSVDSPSLYQVEVQLVRDHKIIDRAGSPFGIRTISLDPVHGLRVNGERVILKGGCIHHDNGVIGANEYDACALRRIQILKGCGFNAIRCAHAPASRAILDACDRMGMLVLDEIFDVWNDEKNDFDYSLFFQEFHMADLERMIAKDYNHPSVIMYSIGNEIVETGDSMGAAISREMAAFIRREDPNRLITNSIDGAYSVRPFLCAYANEHSCTMDELLQQMKDSAVDLILDPIIAKKTAEAFAAVDVAGYSYLSERYLLDHESYPSRMILGTEVRPRELIYCTTLAERSPWFLGQFVYAAWDYLGDAGKGRVDYSPAARRGNRGEYPWYIAYNADVDITGDRRPASYYHEILFRHRTAPYIAVQDPKNHSRPHVTTHWAWNDYVGSWTFEGCEGQRTSVEVYTLGDSVELFLNGKSLGTAAAGEENLYIARFEITYQPGTLKAVAYKDGVSIGQWELSTAGSATVLTATCSSTALTNRRSDLAFLEIELTDGQGTRKYAVEDRVTLKVTGPLAVLGFGSADPKSEENFFDRTRTTFAGRAFAVLQPTGATGSATVQVKSQKHGTCTIPITIREAEKAKNPFYAPSPTYE